MDSFAETKEIQDLPGIRSAIVYQKATAKAVITEEEMSDEMKSIGGFSHASDDSAVKMDAGWSVNAPIVILDDASFQAYCEEIGVTPRLTGLSYEIKSAM